MVDMPVRSFSFAFLRNKVHWVPEAFKATLEEHGHGHVDDVASRGVRTEGRSHRVIARVRLDTCRESSSASFPAYWERWPAP